MYETVEKIIAILLKNPPLHFKGTMKTFLCLSAKQTNKKKEKKTFKTHLNIKENNELK